MTLKHWRWCIETNALALNLLTQRALPLMRGRRAHRRDVQPGSQRARCRATASSARPKAALESRPRARRNWGPRGIRVNVVSAGVVDTDALAYFPNRDEVLANFAARTPAGRC